MLHFTKEASVTRRKAAPRRAKARRRRGHR
jgi:hypothetical protein